MIKKSGGGSSLNEEDFLGNTAKILQDLCRKDLLSGAERRLTEHFKKILIRSNNLPTTSRILPLFSKGLVSRISDSSFLRCIQSSGNHGETVCWPILVENLLSLEFNLGEIVNEHAKKCMDNIKKEANHYWTGTKLLGSDFTKW
jgi:hypothetical protein